MTDERSRGHATVSLPEMRRAGVAVCLATLLARAGPQQKAREAYGRTDLDYACPAIAYAVAQGQLAYYRLLEREGQVRILHSRADLEEHWRLWLEHGAEAMEGAASGGLLPVGLVLSMEGTDPIVPTVHAAGWYNDGLRAAGPAHYGRSWHAHGTGTSGPLSEAGEALLEQFARLGIALDVTHLSDASMAQALDRFDGPVLASHHNCRALVPHERQLTDEQIGRLIGRDAVIGLALDAWMLHPGWRRGQTRREQVRLDAAADHIDHVCQMAGSARHAAIGSDLDGGFGSEQTPLGLDSIADLHKLADILADRAYTEADLDAIFHGNWLRFLRRVLPD